MMIHQLQWIFVHANLCKRNSMFFCSQPCPKEASVLIDLYCGLKYQVSRLASPNSSIKPGERDVEIPPGHGKC